MLNPHTNTMEQPPRNREVDERAGRVCRCHDGINEETAGIMLDFLTLVGSLDMFLPMQGNGQERDLAMLRQRILRARRRPRG